MGLVHVEDARLLEMPTNRPGHAGAYERIKKWDLDQLNATPSRWNGEYTRTTALFGLYSEDLNA